MLIRQWAEKTDFLHEAQVMHLRVYWQVIASSKKNEITIDFNNKTIEFRTPKNTKIIHKGIKVFLESVEHIIGKNWKLRLKQGKKHIVTWKYR